MKCCITFMLFAMLRSALSQSVRFGLLVCEQGPVIYRQSTVPGIFFRILPPSQSQCTAGKIVCNKNFGLFDGHRGLGMCSISRDCAGGQQVCLRKFSGGSNTIVGCCKPAFKAWALSGSQQISGSQNPSPLANSVRMAVSADNGNEDMNMTACFDQAGFRLLSI